MNKIQKMAQKDAKEVFALDNRIEDRIAAHKEYYEAFYTAYRGLSKVTVGRAGKMSRSSRLASPKLLLAVGVIYFIYETDLDKKIAKKLKETL